MGDTLICKKVLFPTELHCSVERIGPSLESYSEVPKVSGYFPSHKIHF